jgi:hypothetical protein
MTSNQDKGGAGKDGRMLVSRWVLVGAVASIIFLASTTSLVYLQLNSQIGSQQKEIDRLQNLLSQYNVTTYPVGSNTCSPVPDTSPSMVNLSQMSNGIELTASLNATTMKTGQTVRVTVDALNTLPEPLKVFTTLPFPVYGMDSAASGLADLPLGMALYSGYFTCSNVSSAQPLSIHLEQLATGCGSGGCPTLDYVVLQPTSGNASANWGASSGYWDVQPMHLVATVSAYYTLVISNVAQPYPYPGPLTYPYNGYWQDGTPMQGTVQSLDPGTYTIAAGTTWGQLVLLHLIVQGYPSFFRPGTGFSLPLGMETNRTTNPWWLRIPT